MSDQHASKKQTAAARGFQHLEHLAYILVGLLLAGAAGIALINASISLWHEMMDLGGKDQILGIIDQLLFVFMLIEILHTVRASMQTDGLSCEPFLIVGLIASIRRVLVITLQSSEMSKDQDMTPAKLQMMHESMFELMVMGGLILVIVVSIFLLHRATAQNEEPAGTSF